jgi:hypothetical protein
VTEVKCLSWWPSSCVEIEQLSLLIAI